MLEDVGEGLLDPGLHVVGHDRRRGVRDPADGLGDLVRGAVMQQSPQQRRICSARQQHRHVGVGIVRRASWLTSSCAARLIRRSGQSTTRSGVSNRSGPNASATARREPRRPRSAPRSGRRPAIPCRTAAPRSSRGRPSSTKTNTRCRAYFTKSGRSVRNISRMAASARYSLVEPDQPEHQHGEDDDDQPGALGELGHREDADHDRRQDPRGQVDRQPGVASPIRVGSDGVWSSRSRPSRIR